ANIPLFQKYSPDSTYCRAVLWSGFSISAKNKQLIIDATPPYIPENATEKILTELIEQLKENTPENEHAFYQMVATHLATLSVSIPNEKIPSEELQKTIDNLFASDYHNYTPNGKKIITILSDEMINKLFE
ncbi:MAG TPA: hypothetical protein EYP69_00565, partial [Bacteroidales bacterium]|nr:hypothetical protein [Bacteroidales bacterium]